jgi:hypothetical protein
VCETLIECFITYFNNGIRSGGGIGDFLDKKTYSDPNYYIRWITDLIFYITIILLLLSMINGIIVSTFSSLREEEENIQDDMNNRCLVCSLDCDAFLIKNFDFDEHKFLHHNAYNYIYYALGLRMKHIYELDSEESYVKAMIEEKNVNVFPIKKAIVLEDNN